MFLEPKAEETPPPEELIKSEKNGSITLIGINRAEVRNCINSTTAQQLSEAIETFENDPESPVAILYGVGGNFCSGYDLKELSQDDNASASLIIRSEGAMVSLPLILIKSRLIERSYPEITFLGSNSTTD